MSDEDYRPFGDEPAHGGEWPPGGPEEPITDPREKALMVASELGRVLRQGDWDIEIIREVARADGLDVGASFQGQLRTGAVEMYVELVDRETQRPAAAVIVRWAPAHMELALWTRFEGSF